MRTLDDVIREVERRGGDLDKEIYHYLMMYRYLLRKQAERSSSSRPAVVVKRSSKGRS